jgi:hypothetical protein
MAIDVLKRQADRLRVLRAIFDAADGVEREPVRVAPTIELQLDLPSKEVHAACAYLVGERLISPIATIEEGPTIYVAVELTHLGVVEMEQSIGVPNKPTKHFPPAISVISINNSTFTDSPIRSASPNASQTSTSD